MKPKFKAGEVVEFSKKNLGYYTGRTREYGRGPFTVLDIGMMGVGVSIAPLGSQQSIGRFHVDNLELNKFLTVVHKANKRAKTKKAGENAA